MLSESKLFDTATVERVQNVFSEIAIKTLASFQNAVEEQTGVTGKKGDWQKYFRPDPVLLELAAESALIDLDRMARFHLSDSLPDNHKYAGYFAYWVAKIRPIQFVTPLTKDFKLALSINAKFAVEIVLHFIHPTTPLTAKAAQAMLYTFQFREMSPQNSALLAYALERDDNPTPSDLPTLKQT